MKFALFVNAVAAVLSTASFAADLPSRKAPPVYAPPPSFSWTGFYLGGQAGYGFGRDAHNVPTEGAYFVASPGGFVGGGFVGYNYQVSQFVFGLEGDVDGSTFAGSALNGVTGTTVRTKIPLSGSVLGRLGYAADRTLFYATGGASFGNIDHSYFPAAGGLFDYKSTRVGYTIGGGVEYVIANNYTIRGEYLYTDYGKYSDLVAGFVPVYGRAIEQKVLLGLSYKFDTPPAPVVARY